MITNYKVVESVKKSVLEKEVKDLIAKGWQPLGGICCVLRRINHKGDIVAEKGQINLVYMQAITK